MKNPKQSSKRSRPSTGDRKWVPVVDPKPGARGPILAPLAGDPTPETVAEATKFVETLEANNQIARPSVSGPLPPGATHCIETDATGAKRLVRRRFSAL